MINIKDEILKVMDIPKGYGVLNICESIFFPYSNQEISDIGFWIEKDNFIDKNFIEAKKQNHLFPNKGYVTMVRTSGRKICKAGYPILVPLSDKNMKVTVIAYLHMNKQYLCARFPILIHDMDKNHPYANVNIRWDDESQTKKGTVGLLIRTFQFDSSDGYSCWEDKCYLVGNAFNLMDSTSRFPYIDITPDNNNYEDNGPDIKIITASDKIDTYGMSWDDSLCDYAF